VTPRRLSSGPLARVPDQLSLGYELRGVSFSYPQGSHAALTDIDLSLRAGTVIAVVGENGAGKTTLVKLLTRMYEPTAGQILIEGTDLRDLPLADYRARLAAGFQDFVHFELLVRESVGVGDLPRITDTQAVLTALERSSAEFAQGLGSGLETQLGRSWEDGTDLSGGEWQKLALSRAMMRDYPLLTIFDEPTSALDPQTEHAMFERIARQTREQAAGGGITLLISHRFSTVRMADLIVVLKQGRVVEQGSHEELMARPGLYAELYGLQARAYDTAVS
jgi:ATP-binding cassette subfamily B protein